MQLTDSAALILYAKPDFISNTLASVKVHTNTDSSTLSPKLKVL